jgi:hypothetical protein
MWKQEMEARLQEEENAKLLQELRGARSLPNGNGNMYGYSNGTGSLNRASRGPSTHSHHINGSSHPPKTEYAKGYEEHQYHHHHQQHANEKRSSVRNSL